MRCDAPLLPDNAILIQGGWGFASPSSTLRRKINDNYNEGRLA
jgi:hypothetical protein